jgi:hypothetical protein
MIRVIYVLQFINRHMILRLTNLQEEFEDTKGAIRIRKSKIDFLLLDGCC